MGRDSAGTSWAYPRKTLLVDFDGTLGPFSYPGVPDKPYAGVIEGLRRLYEGGFSIWIFTTRAWPGWKKIDGAESYWQKLQDVKDFLRKWDIPYNGITHEKIPAMFIIDDRALNLGLHGWDRVVEIVEGADRSDPYGRIRTGKGDADAAQS